jgi:hypothetical protein
MINGLEVEELSMGPSRISSSQILEKSSKFSKIVFGERGHSIDGFSIVGFFYSWEDVAIGKNARKWACKAKRLSKLFTCANWMEIVPLILICYDIARKLLLPSPAMVFLLQPGSSVREVRYEKVSGRVNDSLRFAGICRFCDVVHSGGN